MLCFQQRTIKSLVLIAFLNSICFIQTESSTINTSATKESQQEWNVPLIIQACPDIASTRICDPDHVLSEHTPTSISSDDEVDKTGTDTDGINNHIDNNSTNQQQREEDSITSISVALYELETNHPLVCVGTRSGDSGSSSTSTPVQMAVVVVNEIEMNGPHYLDDSYKINQAKMVATALHNSWGVGTTECGGSGIVLFLSVKDRVVYISIGDGLVPILTLNRIDSIIEDMKPFLRDEEYSQAIVNSIFSIIRYLDQGPPSFLEKYLGFIIIGTVALAMLGADKWNKKKKTEYVRIKSHLEKMDRERAMALMGKFECTSCPICLEDFQKVEPDASTVSTGKSDASNELYLGSDGKPVQLLQCGHSFDKTCWDSWISRNSKNMHQCPICKQDIGGGVHVDSDRYQLDIPTRNEQQRPLVSFFGLTDSTNSINPLYRSRFTAQQQREMYELERQFRIHRLRHRYPYYIRQTHVDRWTRNDYDGNMAQDGDFINQDPNLKSSNSSTSHSQGHSFGSFGGGQSGGGGGGTW